MALYRFKMSRVQIQVVQFAVEASDIGDLSYRLNEADFSKIDQCFDGGEVESIYYDLVGKIHLVEGDELKYYRPDRSMQQLLDRVELPVVSEEVKVETHTD
jgi:hypothetical protein